MGRKILFSPIGGTDPIKYCRDGSMLHICRIYKPEIVCLYLSHEMLQNHRTDNRYVESIQRLGKLIDHEFEIHIIERDELVNVQQYDVFYEDFRNIIHEMEEGMQEDDELLINMASGTPAMKSALLVLATLAEYRFKAMQVSSPLKRQNSDYEERKEYDVDEFWELNEDNEEGFENRVYEVQCMNLLKLLKIDMIKKHIKAYDYPAALSVAKEIKEDITEEAYTLLEIADARVKLNRRMVDKLNNQKHYNIFPVVGGKEQKLFEYALVLQMKVAKEEYADFIRGITPIVVDLLECILKNVCGLKLEDLTVKNKQGVPLWNEKKLRDAGVMSIFESEYKNVGFKFGPVYSIHIAKLIENLSNDRVINERINSIIKIESQVRNVAAHEIVSVTDEWFKKNTGKTAAEIMKLIKDLFKSAGIKINGSNWSAYDDMNCMIEKALF